MSARSIFVNLRNVYANNSQAFFVAAYGDTGFSTASDSDSKCLSLDPYTDEDEAYTKLATEYCLDKSNNLVVPSIFECT